MRHALSAKKCALCKCSDHTLTLSQKGGFTLKRTKLADRVLPNYSRTEELFNTISHVVGGLLAIAALVLCILMGVMQGDGWGVTSGAIYGSTMIILYTASSLYHGLRAPIPKRVFQIIDHCSIFLLIAGTYTPLTLAALRPQYPGVAWTVFGIIWGSAALGIVLNAIDLKRFSKFSMICYLAMGWCIVIAIRPLLAVMAMPGIVLLFSGGVAYTIGAVLYNLGKKKYPFMHAVFHLFVLVGSILHFFCILLYCIPLGGA